MDNRTENQEALLTVSGLDVSIGNPPVHAVRDVQFTVMRGEIVGLAGESGSGKSVSAQSLTRLLPAAARPKYHGQVHLEGVEDNLLKLPERLLRKIRGRRIGYIFQEPSTSFNPLFSIQAHMREVLRLTRTEPADRNGAIRNALEEVGIPADREHMRAYPGAFSGGMLQRTAIACALLAKPDILIADEATTALDTTTQKRIMDLLVRLNRDYGMAILFISHDLGLLYGFTDRLMVMKTGSIVEAGQTSALLENPAHPYTRKLLDVAPRLRL